MTMDFKDLLFMLLIFYVILIRPKMKKGDSENGDEQEANTSQPEAERSFNN